MFSPPIGDCIQEKISSLARKASGCFEFNWEYIFFQGQCAIMELCYSPWLPDHWQNTHTRTQTSHAHMVWLCENVTSQHQQNIQSEDQSEETSDTLVQVILQFSCINLPFFYGPAVVPLALWICQVCCQGNMTRCIKIKIRL